MNKKVFEKSNLSIIKIEKRKKNKKKKRLIKLK